MDNPLDPSIAANVTGRPDPLTRAEKIPQAFRGVNPVDPDSRPSQSIFVRRPSATIRRRWPGSACCSASGVTRISSGSAFLRSFAGPGADQHLRARGGRISPPAAWAVGITTQQIDALFTAAGLANQKWQVEIIAGYSTGYRGVNGTINNELVPLDKLKTVIFYDALYSGGQPSPGGNTELMLDSLAAGVRSWSTTSPSRHPPSPPGEAAGRRSHHRSQDQPSLALALVLARVIEKGVKDKYVKAAEVPAASRR